MKCLQFFGSETLRLVARVAVCVACSLVAVAAPVTNAPIDWRHRIPGSEFERNATGEWVSPVIRPPFPCDEVIYCWHLDRPGDSFRLFLKAEFGPGDNTEWLYAGYWGSVKTLSQTARPLSSLKACWRWTGSS